MKKILPVFILSLVLLVPNFAGASTAVDQRIAYLREQIAFLVNQLALLQSGQNTNTGGTNTGGTGTSSNQTCVDLRNDFTLAATDRLTNGEVTRLQNFLRTRAEAVWPQAISSTGYFGLVTQKALSNFQLDHALFTSSFSRGAGTLDRATRDFIKNLTCGDSDGGSTLPPVNTGAQRVELSVSKNSGLAPLSVTLVATLNNLPSCTGVSFNFGDGISASAMPSCSAGDSAVVASRTISQNHVYQTAGTYTASVSAGSLSDLETIRVSVAEIPPAQYAPMISFMQPSSGPVGTRVTLYGTGFTPTGNRIQFGNLGTENNSAYNLNASGDFITFTVPTSNYMSCWQTTPACMTPVVQTAPGTYEVKVINSNGTSNPHPFVVTGNTAGETSIRILTPSNSATWQIGSTQRVSWDTQNMPSGAALLISLSGGPTPGRLRLIQNVASAGDTDITVPDSIFAGDVGMNLAPGSYHLVATLYDKVPCLGLCFAVDTSRVLARAETTAVITITSRVTNTEPSAALSANPISGVAPLTVNFSASVKNAPSCSGYNWNFGDGNQSQVTPSCTFESTQIRSDRVITTSHTYTTAGTFVVNFGMGSEISESMFIIVTVPVVYRKGDVNMDGNITLVDYLMVFNYINNTGTLTTEQKALADYNSDTHVNVTDADLIRQYLLYTPNLNIPITIWD